MASQVPSFKAQPPQGLGEMARLMQQKFLIEKQREAAKKEQQRRSINDILTTVQMGQKMATNAIAISQAQNKIKATKDLASLVQQLVAPTEGPLMPGQEREALTAERQPELLGQARGAAIKAGMGETGVSRLLFPKETTAKDLSTIAKNFAIARRMDKTPAGEKISSMINAQAKSIDIKLQKKADFYESLDFDVKDYRTDKGLTLKGKAEISALTNLIENKVRVEKKRASLTGVEFTETNVEDMLTAIAPVGLLTAKEKQSMLSKLKRRFHIAPSAPLSPLPEEFDPMRFLKEEGF